MAKKSAVKSAKPNGAPVVAEKKSKKGKPVKKPEPESEEEMSEEEMPVEPVATKRKQKVNGKAPPAKKSKKPEPESEEDEEMESEEEESDEEDIDDEDEESEEEVVPKKAKVAKPAKKLAKKPQQEEESEEDDEEEEDEEEEEDDDDEEEDDDEDDDDDDEEEEEDDEEEEEKPKKKTKETAETETACLFVGNLVPDENEDRESKLTSLFKKKGIKVKEIRSNPLKRFCHVEIADASQVTKALTLNGTDFQGQALKLDTSEKRTDAAKTPSKEGPKSEGTRVVMFKVSLPQEAIQEATGCQSVFKLDSKEIAFLDFETQTAAAEFVQEGFCTIDGETYNVEIAKPKTERTPRAFNAAGPTNKCVVFNISCAADEITAAAGCERTETNENKNMAFLFFDTPEAAKDAASSGTLDVNGESYSIEISRPRNAPGGSPRGGRGGRGGNRGGGDSSCYNCGESGHFSRECPSGGSGGNRGGRGRGGRGRGGSRGRGGRW